MVETRQGNLHYIVNNHVTNSKLYATLLMWQYNLGVHEMVLKTLKLKNDMNKLKVITNVMMGTHPMNKLITH